MAEGVTMKAQDRKCRVCDCTDGNCRQCVAKTREACVWVAEDLCSACAPDGTVGKWVQVVVDSESNVILSGRWVIVKGRVRYRMAITYQGRPLCLCDFTGTAEMGRHMQECDFFE